MTLKIFLKEVFEGVNFENMKKQSDQGLPCLLLCFALFLIFEKEKYPKFYNTYVTYVCHFRHHTPKV